MELVVKEADCGVWEGEDGAWWWVERGRGRGGAVLEDCEAAGDGWSIPGFELDVVCRLSWVREGV